MLRWIVIVTAAILAALIAGASIAIIIYTFTAYHA